MSQSYHQQFRTNQRNKYQNGSSSTSNFVPTDKVFPQRPTAVSKKPSRSDTFTLPTKHYQINPKAPYIDPEQNNSQRQTRKQPIVKNTSSSIEIKQKNSDIRSALKQPHSTNQQRNLVRFAKQHNTSEGDEHLIHRQKQSPSYAYNDHRKEKRIVEVIRDSSSRETDHSYYIESKPKHIVYEHPTRRSTMIQKTSPTTEYIYVDEMPSTNIPGYHRSKRTYIHNNRPLNYEEEIIYVDDHGNEIQYMYDDKPIYRRRNDQKTVVYHSSPNIVYE
ncbi:hypothetical protein I4U23_002173 [Adineta vaga]|nr:hypothetical protein I4U23_002173 [Adineta vaga]